MLVLIGLTVQTIGGLLPGYSGYVLMLNGAVSWRCKRQSLFALSSAEAEFIAASSMVQEVIFLCKFLDNLGFRQNGPTPIFADNETYEGSVGGSDRAKHIDLRKHCVHDARRQGILQLQKIDSEFNGADLLTKPFKDTSMLVESHRKHLMGYQLHRDRRSVSGGGSCSAGVTSAFCGPLARVC